MFFCGLRGCDRGGLTGYDHVDCKSFQIKANKIRLHIPQSEEAMLHAGLYGMPLHIVGGPQGKRDDQQQPDREHPGQVTAPPAGSGCCGETHGVRLNQNAGGAIDKAS